MNSLKILALFIDFAGSIVIGIASIIILFKYLFQSVSISNTRLLQSNYAQILVFALTLKSGAAFVNSIFVGSWEQFSWFLVIVALRFLIGRTLQWNKSIPAKTSATS